jgi:hypothetical protein
MLSRCLIASGLMLAACAPGTAEPPKPAGLNAAARAPTRLPAPDWGEDGHIAGWIVEGDLEMAPPGGPADARFFAVIYTAAEAGEPRAALQRALASRAMADASIARIEPVDAHVQVAGNPGWIAAGTSRRGGHDQRFMAFIKQTLPGGEFSVSVFEAAREDYAAWGGVATPLILFNAVRSNDSITPAFRQKAARGQPVDDLAIFEAFMNAEIDAMIAGLSAQMSTQQMLQQMNTDIGTTTQCIMTTGCQIGTGANGQAVMNFPDD